MYLPFSRITIPKGITAVTGSGGKTTFLRYMSSILPGSVILTTTTHILPFSGLPLILTDEQTDRDSCLRQIGSLLEKERVICIGSPAENGKLSAPRMPLSSLLDTADFILAEADGSHCLPLKAHRTTEPVVPPETSLTVCLVGASGINGRICDVCHCPDIFSRLAEADPEDPATTEKIAAVLNAENLADVYLINQADQAENPETVPELCGKIKKPAAAGSLMLRRFL